MLQGGGEPAFQALLAATEAAAADWGAGAAAAALPAAATAALAEMEAATTSGVSVSVVGKAPAAAASKSKGKSPLRRLLEEAGWDGTAFSGPSFDAKALLSRLKTLQFDDLEEVGKGSYAVVYKVRIFFFCERACERESEGEKLGRKKRNRILIKVKEKKYHCSAGLLAFRLIFSPLAQLLAHASH